MEQYSVKSSSMYCFGRMLGDKGRSSDCFLYLRGRFFPSSGHGCHGSHACACVENCKWFCSGRKESCPCGGGRFGGGGGMVGNDDAVVGNDDGSVVEGC